MAAAGAESPRDQVLAQLVRHVRAHGLPPDASLRWFARELGTSHRMLTYWFGSRAGLLAALLETLRRGDQHELTEEQRPPDRRTAAAQLWAYYADAEREPEHRAFFYVFALALQEPEPFHSFLATLDTWVTLISDLGVAEGLPRDRAETEAQLVVSGFRGLLLDLLATGHRDRVAAAFHALLDLVLPAHAQPASRAASSASPGRAAGRTTSPVRT